MNIDKEKMLLSELTNIYEELDYRVKSQFSHSFNSFVHGIRENIKEVEEGNGRFYYGYLRSNLFQLRGIIERASGAKIEKILHEKTWEEVIRIDENKYQIKYVTVRNGYPIIVDKEVL